MSLKPSFYASVFEELVRGSYSHYDANDVNPHSGEFWFTQTGAAHDVDLRHGGRKIAEKPGQSKG